MASKWLDLAGLLLALSGALILALGLIVSKRRALKIGVSRMAEDRDDQNRFLPHVRDEIRESRFALMGVILLIIGFLLQIVGRIVQLNLP